MRVLKVSVYLQAMKKLFYIIIFCLSSIISLAQSDYDYDNEEERDPRDRRMEQDSVEKPDVKHYRMTWRWMHNGVYKKFIPLDTLTDGIQNFNPIFKQSVSNTYLGNLPSAYESNIFINRIESEDFFPLNRVRVYIFKPEDALEYNTTTPFTQLNYFNGGGRTKSEDLLDVWHVQNIRPYWSAGFRYNIISGLGAYSYQKSKTYNLSFFSSYELKRVAISFFINQNVGHYTENGGIQDLYFLRDTTLDSQLIPTNLVSEPRNNFYNFNLYTLGQYNIGKGKEIVTQRDSARTDTTIVYPMKAVLSFNVQDNQYKFKEKSVETSFFPNTYIDSMSNADIVNNKRFEITTKLIVNEHPKYKYLPGIYAGLNFKYLNYHQRINIDQDTTTNDFGSSKYTGTYLTAGTFNVDTNSLFNFDIWAAYCLFGDYNTDYNLQGEITQYLNRGKNSSVTINASLENKTPNPFYELYMGNHNIWKNNFGKIHSYQLQGKYRNIRRRTEVGIALNNTKGYIYLDTTAMPRQYDGNLMIFTAWVKQNFRLGNFYFDQKVYYQVSNKEDILALPQIALYSHNYYQNRLFKRVLGLQFGIDVFYTTKFYADAYMPSIMQFYNQRKEKIGNYPKMDVFLTLNIKRADIFVKYDHFNEFFGNRNYLSATNYAIGPATVKFGLRWNFFD